MGISIEKVSLIEDAPWMALALEQAEIAASHSEVPVGAVVVVDGQLISSSHNNPIGSFDPTGHAEIRAIRQAAEHLQNYRFENATLYITLEPCTMCLGAIIHSRINRVVFAALEPKAGAIVSAAKLDFTSLNHSIEWTQGVLASEAQALLTSFFKQRRQEKAKDHRELKDFFAKVQSQGKKIATAESCTGGAIAKALTDKEGSSAWFERGWVTYTPESKHEQLGVSLDAIDKGVVSALVAEEMAQGALQKSEANLAISVTGVAGPTGGTSQHPVGCCWFGFAFDWLCDQAKMKSFQAQKKYITEVNLITDQTRGSSIISVRCDFKGDRTAIRKIAVQFALIFAARLL